jgi:hypothetical protein
MVKPILLLCLLLSLADLAASAIAVRAAFELDSGNEVCTEDDWNKIFGGTLRKRNLRQLQTGPWYCDYVCKNWVSGRCWLRYPLCVGYRRKLQEEEPSDDIVRNLQVRKLSTQNQECLNAITETSNALNNAVGISSECQVVIDSPRSLDCFNIEENPCSISHIKLWDADSDKVIQTLSPYKVNEFCRGDIRFAFEAIATDTCVKKVTFQISGGPNQVVLERIEFQAPFYNFGNTGADVYGEKFAPGLYELKARENSLSTWSHTLQFRVKDC